MCQIPHSRTNNSFSAKQNQNFFFFRFSSDYGLRCLIGLSNLQVLDFSNCYSIQGTDAAEVFSHLNSLTDLNVQVCVKVRI